MYISLGMEDIPAMLLAFGLKPTALMLGFNILQLINKLIKENIVNPPFSRFVLSCIQSTFNIVGETLITSPL